MWVPRVALLIIAVAGGAVAAVTLSCRGGLAYVNLDSALHDSLVFYACVVAPLVVAAGAVMACIVPRIVTINIAVTLGLVIAVEIATRLFVAPPPMAHGEPEPTGGTGLYVRDTALGYAMAPSTTVRHRRMIGETSIYDVTYRTDARGRRETRATGGGVRRSFLLFFGDSNVFGEGLSETETLPHFAAEVASDYRVYNYGVPGYGPAQLLTLARRGGIRDEVEGVDGYAVFVVIPAHIGRVVGSSRVSTGWGRHFPHYVENRRGELVRIRDFTYGRPLTTLAYFLWAQSAVADRLGIELPLWYSDRDYRLTARMLQESSRLLTEQLRLRGSVVVLAQVNDDTDRRIMDGVRNALEREGTAYLDYTRLIDSHDRQYRLAERDYHYSAKANRIVAQRLVADLLGTRAKPSRRPRPAVPAHAVALAYDDDRHGR